jgi:DNA modification methylase
MAGQTTVLFRTRLGEAVAGDSLHFLDSIEAESVDLVMTSPPFALLRKKTYGNADQADYVDWLCQFAPSIHRVLKPAGSYVIDLGGAYQRGKPVRSLHQYRLLIRHVDDFGFHLAEEFFWHNPSKLPSPIEWVNKRKIRVKDTVNSIWWLSKTEWPKADASNVLAPYSERMKVLLKDPDRFYTPKDRPSGHNISGGFAKDNGGAIPPNLLQFPNSESNGRYLQLCKSFAVEPHPARFPLALPEFFIKFLTDEGDLVLDIFGGSGTTGEAAEALGRRWRTIEIERVFARASMFRFVGDRNEESITALLGQIDQGQSPAIVPRQIGLFDAVG